jgi:hypothetical protein
MAKQHYEIKALADNQVEVQPKTSESYRTILKASAEKRTQFHTYKLKKERSYRVALKNMHYHLHQNVLVTRTQVKTLYKQQTSHI